ncbi:MAG TPA: D-Ala-D-Ala carboxypeptidase family metallohydrolase [Allosphingosinicella sp.]|nr:D-Ala-D-Ala carboxypeptidase family metallohydrolase [Allosphingosinicella sp.]
MLLFVPISAHARLDIPAPSAAPPAGAPRTALEARDLPSAPAPSVRAPVYPETRGDLAPGQSRADYYAWLARDPRHQQQVQAFRDHLVAQGLADVVPVWQLIRTSSSWRACNAERFEVAPPDKWAHITTTLRFVRDEVEPVLGPVEALSAYRNEQLNRCSAGAPQSAHRHFFALDLAPVDPAVSRTAMIRQICAAHARDGRAYNTGLGFYTGMRFHVDSNGYRKWGADGRGASSPCGSAVYA